MVILIRVVFVAGVMGGSLAGLWWFCGQIDRDAAVFNRNIPAWAVGVAGGLIAGCGEGWRIFIEFRQARRNREAVAEAGCEYNKELSLAELRTWPPICLFRNESPGGSQRMTGVFHGRQIDVFDFRYTVSAPSTGDTSSSSSTSYTQTVFRFPKLDQNWSPFLLKPRRRWAGLLGSLFSSTEIILEPDNDADDGQVAASAKFQKHYQITVPDDTISTARLQRLFRPPVVSWLFQHPGWSMECKGSEVFAWRSNVTSVGQDRLRRLEQLSELLSRMDDPESQHTDGQPLQFNLRTLDRHAGFSGFLGMWMGSLLGMFFGGVLFAVIVSESLVLWRIHNPPFPVLIVSFFGGALAFAVAGAFLGRRWGKTSKWGHRLADRIDPRPASQQVTHPEDPVTDSNGSR